MKKGFFFLVFIMFIVLMPLLSFAGRSGTPVSPSHLDMINLLFSENSLKEALVGLDRYGRVELKGGYKDSEEVSLAFSLAQSVVGVKWVSPVTPENVKVKEWEKQLSKQLSTLFGRKKTTPLLQDEGTRNRPSEKYALVVGISKFKNSDKYKLNTGIEMNLKYAERDAQEIYSYLVDPQYGNYNKENVFLLLNENATRSNIQQAIDAIKGKSGYNDDILIYFSSHGTPSKYDGSMDIVTYDTDLKSSFTSWKTAFPAEHLKDFIHEIKAKKLVVVLDVCFSGAAFKNISGFYYAGSKTIDFDNDNQGISKAVMAKSLMGAKDVVFEDDVIKVTDASNKEAIKILISASDAGERSWESDSLKGSIFTNYFLRGLKKSSNIGQAFDYARPTVTQYVKEEKDADQHPQVVADKKDWGEVAIR